MREGWDTALDYQTDLIRQAQTRQGTDYLYALADEMATGSILDPNTGERHNADRERSHELVNASTYMLTACDPIYVAPDLCDIINFAAETFRPEALHETDLIVPAGFTYFAKPLLQRDTHGRVMAHRAMMWCITTRDDSSERGILVAMYAHCDDPDPYADLREDKIGPIGGSRLGLAHVTTFPFDDPRIAEDFDPSITDLIRHLQVFFRLTQQTIAVRSQERVGRPIWKRASAWRKIKEVTVFTLRRAQGPRYEGDEREVEWTHRWMVGAHWRNQPYKENGATVYRQIWIAPYIKGPEGKPLILKRRAFELVR